MKRFPYLDGWERWAYRIDLWRVVPRSVLAVYGISSWRVAEWFMALPEPNTAHGAFVSVVAGIAPLLFQFYAVNGIDWEKRIDRLLNVRASNAAIDKAVD